jgi:hypothetical protein
MLTATWSTAWYASRMTAQTRLRWLLIMNFASSVAHYADNIVRFGAYPEPMWLSPWRVDAFWFVMTPVGAVAYALCRMGKVRAAALASYAYGAMGLLTLGHYLVAPPWRIGLVINALILLEAASALWLIAYAARQRCAAPA